MKKRVLSILLAIVMIAACIPITSMTASAAEAGTLPSNAISLTAGQWHTKRWTRNNYRLNCFNKIVVPSRGYITFVAEKPFDDEGEMGSFVLTLYKANSSEVWSCSTGAQKDTFSAYYIYKIGLAAGTYYMNLDPSFYIYSDSAPISARYKYTFTKSNYWEMESNNTKATATTLTLDKSYNAVYAEESYYSANNYEDYFKVKLTKGNVYRLVIGSAKKLDAACVYMKFHDPRGEGISGIYLGRGKESGNCEYYDFKAEYTGWYYLRFYDEYNEEGVQYTVKVMSKSVSVSALNVSLSTTTYTYDGKVKSPSVTVKNANGTTLTKGTDYTVTYASGRKNVGTYKVTVTMKGNYSGTKTLTFKINPKAATVSSLTAKNKALTVKINRQMTQSTGYELQYSTNKSFSGAKHKYLSYKTSSYTITGLKAKTTYYVRVRTYKNVNGKAYYSGWSTIKYVKTK